MAKKKRKKEFRVYRLKGLDNGKPYVGFTSRPMDERLAEHRSMSGRRNASVAYSRKYPTEEAARDAEKRWRKKWGLC